MNDTPLPHNPEAEAKRDKERLAWMFTRDLSTCDRGELEMRWDAGMRLALSRAGTSFEQRVQDPEKPHIPFYYVAERLFFENVAGDKRWLYPPLHRDMLCARAWKYFTDPASAQKSGFLTLMSRDLLKTTFSHGAWPVTASVRDYHLFSKRDGDGRIIFADIPKIALVHHKEDLAKRNLKRLKDRVRTNPWFRMAWPEFIPGVEIKKWGSATELTWPCAPSGVAEVSIKAAGLSSSLTGFHYRYRFNSDMVTEDHLRSQAIRDEAASQYDAARYTRDSLKYMEFDDGTRYHVRDLYGRMIKTNSDRRTFYDVLRVPAIGPNDELAHPYRLPREYLEHLRQEEINRVGHDIYWHLQMQCDAKSSTVDVANSEWLQWVRFEDIPEDGGIWMLHIDSAWKGQHNQGMGDFAAGWVTHTVRRGSLVLRYFVDGFYSNEMSIHDGEWECIRLMKKWGVADVTYEEYGGHGLRTSFQTACASNGVPLNLIDLKNKPQHKTQRMLSFTKAAQARAVYICDSIPQDMKDALINFMDDFPQAKPDDVGDAASQSFDPAVADEYMPKRPMKPWWQKKVEMPDPLRTRYSGL